MEHTYNTSQGFKHKHRNKYKYVPGNKSEGQGYSNRIKQKIIYDYNKLKRKETARNEGVQKLYKDEQESKKRSNTRTHPVPLLKPKPGKKKTKFSKAEWEYTKKADEKQDKYKESLKTKMEREAALAKYKERKRQRFLKLCKRTSRGQPILNNQISLLLDKLQKQNQVHPSS